MADKKRNITGSYPGADGASRPKRINPAGSYPSAKAEQSTIRIANQPKAKAELEQTRVMKTESVKNEAVKTEPAKEETPKAKEKNAEGKVFTKEVWQKYARSLGYYSAILISAVLLSCWICHIGNEVLGLVRPDKEITIMVEEGQTSVKAVAKVLKEAEIIDHPNIFFLYSKLKKSGDFYEGEFTLNCKSDYNQLIRALKRDPAQKDKVTFTIKEGYTQEDLVTTLCDSLEYLEREELENVLQNYDFSEFTFAAHLPERNYRLEGYLYPDTYEMYEGESAVAVVRRILSRFEEKVLTDENMKKISDSDYDLDEVITLASILQKESGKNAKKAAGVYLNRLESKSVPYLESQATVAYILPAGHGEITEADIRTSDPYNTYRNKGLPEGPIANPGEEMILAVLEAEKTEDLYFVTREDGEMFFAKTRTEHLLNLKKAGEHLRGTGTVS
ncbi:MAG: endolytic transglycosylase MltG [Clostridia bacterium]|nr:endolytic transglycosylase MltG [Clostridia bacterium]